MEYQSAFLWEKGNEEHNRSSLILQQVTIHRQSVLFACVCESENKGEAGVLESGYFTEGLVEWFHRELVKLLEKKGTRKEAERSLHKEVERLWKELSQHAQKEKQEENLHCIGLLLWDSQFWMFSKGRGQAHLLNRRFQKKNMHFIESGSHEAEFRWKAGSIQKRLGILLCTPGFWSHLERAEVAEVLSPEGEISEERLQKRLQELWQENVQRGAGTSAGAVYIRT